MGGKAMIGPMIEWTIRTELHHINLASQGLKISRTSQRDETRGYAGPTRIRTARISLVPRPFCAIE